MKIFGIGMNYLLHTEELDGRAYRPEEPVVFLKPDSAVLKDGKPFFVPDWAERFDYEAELVVRVGRLGKSISKRYAHRYYDAFTVGIDFTARDLQERARSSGLPWSLCKGFDGSAALGRFRTVEGFGQRGVVPAVPASFRLDVNGVTVQHGLTADMLFSVDELVSYLSRYFTLKTGDLIFTGTPVGVGPVAIGDHLQGWLDDELVLDFYCR